MFFQVQKDSDGLPTQLLNASCDDPGAVIGLQLALPIIQERLDARALQFAEERAKMAEEEVIRMEVRCREMGSFGCGVFCFDKPLPCDALMTRDSMTCVV